MRDTTDVRHWRFAKCKELSNSKKQNRQLQQLKAPILQNGTRSASSLQENAVLLKSRLSLLAGLLGLPSFKNP
jgi:hypothetical protein